MLLAALLPAADPRPGTVDFSDGTSWSGAIALAGGARLQLHDGTTMRTLDLQQVAELRFLPRAESLERAFSMPEAGRTVRVETGEAYPLRQLAARISLADGTVAAGNLYATALVVTIGDERRKLPLPSKQRGRPGERLDQLVFVQRIAFADGGGSPPRRLPIRLAAPADELGAVARDGLAPLRIAAGAVDDPLGQPLLWALRRGGAAQVGFAGDDPDLRARLTAAVAGLDDFFDRLEVMAARSAGDDVLAVMRLARTRATTDGPSLPWHIEVWRWRLDGERALIAGRACLLRGTDGQPPAVALVPAWANLAPVDGVYVLEP